MAYLKYSELCIRTTLTFTIHFKLRITILNIRNILSFPFNELIVKVNKNVLQFYKMTSFEKKIRWKICQICVHVDQVMSEGLIWAKS